MNLWEFVKGALLLRPDQLICENGREISYAKMVSLAEDLAFYAGKHSCCAIMCSSELNAAVGLLACFAASVTAVPLSKRYGSVHCKRILDSISPDALITDENGSLYVLPLTDPHYTPPKKKPALIMCTSGTSGAPKGVMLTQENIIANVTDVADYFKLKYSDRMLITRPLYHCAVLTGELLTAIVRGAQVRFYSGAFDPKTALRLVYEYGITAFCGTPTLLSLMARFRRDLRPSPLRKIVISGECMDKRKGLAVAAAFPEAEIHHVYGLTEACPRVAHLPPSLFDDYADCVGLPLKSVKVKVVAESGATAKANEAGLLWVSGPNVMSGYYNDPERTDEVLRDGWLCTGDIAEINPLGLLKIKGRADEMFIRAGMNIYPQEIENALSADPRVREVRVKGESDERLGTHIILSIAGDFDSVDQVRQLCSSALPAYQTPTEIKLLDSLPKNGSGKIIRK